MKARFAITAVLAVTAALSTPAMAGAQARPTSAPTLAISSFGLAQPSAVNAAMTSFPLQVHWTNGSAITTQRLYRYDETTKVETLLTTIAGTAGTHQYVDTLPIVGSIGAGGDNTHYVIASFIGSKFFGDTDSPSFSPLALDDAALGGSVTGTWTRKNQSGAVKGRYLVSSTPGADFKYTDCLLNFGLVATTSPQGGKANLYVNGTLASVLNFKTTKTVKRVLIFKVGYTTSTCDNIELKQISGQINIDALQETSTILKD